jgi:hypothetical protein
MIENISKVKVAERLSLDVRSFGHFQIYSYKSKT